MDARAHEPERTPLHGLVSLRPAVLLLPAAIAVALVAAMLGGLLRAGVALPLHPQWVGQAAVHHAALMICAFMGTVIGVERAVALKWRPAWLAPVASALGGIALLAGAVETGRGLLVLAASMFTVATAKVVARQPAPHTAALLLGAACWLAGSAVHAWSGAGTAAVQLWFAFLVITITAERLEMTRLLPRRRGSEAMLAKLLAVLVVGAAISSVAFGAALVGLAAWLATFDIARRTVRAQGLSRYMALGLLGGYAWLAVAGVAWMLAAFDASMRDTALHALGLGFVFSMMFAHAPVILPAVTGLRLRFGARYYAPLALLHAALLLRLVHRPEGALANTIVIACFAATVASSLSRAGARPSRPASRCA